jgi:TonB family protein
MRKPLLRVLALALCCATIPAFASAPATPPAPLETVLSLQVEGEVDIDASGNVLAYRFDTPPPESVRGAVERTIRGWHFVPRIDGAVVQAQTISMRLALGARESGGKYLSRIENVWLTAKVPLAQQRRVETETVVLQAASLGPPRYPLDLAAHGISGKVLVGLRVGVDGKVADAVVVQSALMDAQDPSAGARRALALFEKSALAGARRWRFDVTPGQGVPTPEDLTVLVPVSYAMRRDEAAGKWRSIVRTPRTPPPWLPATDDRSRLGVADVGNGGAVPQAADVRLAVDQAGIVL